MVGYRFRSPLGLAMSLGSAKSGFGHWWTERVTAVALIPLGVWFAASLIAHSGSNYEAFIGWMGSPITAVLMILLLITLFWHIALGLQVAIEDYVHSGTKICLLLITHFLCFALAVGGIVATLRIAIGVWTAT
ncbi:MAG: succinate dehydrogenase, hydrophobic membrane anchor protein [Xanthobacteraceae bacterium]|mgnify:FL=1